MKDHIIGTWFLKKHGFVAKDSGYKPSGTKPRGQLIYDPNGFMSVFISLVEKPLMLSDIIVYSGSYSIEDKIITHHIDYAINPSREGTSEKRFFTLDTYSLILKTEPTEKGYYEIVWSQ